MDAEQAEPCNTTLYLIRHADCRQDDVKRYIGQVDLPLNDRGRKQALSLSAALKNIPFRQIYCSNLNRSYETACIISQNRHEPIQQLSGIREINLGQWDGLSFAEIAEKFPEAYQHRGSDLVNFRPPEGESFHDLAMRVLPWFIKIMTADCGEPVLIVGHAGVNRVILCHILGMPLYNLFRFEQDYGAMNIIAVKNGIKKLLVMNGKPFNCFNI
jgi:alpha-ribazole phosphatase